MCVCRFSVDYFADGTLPLFPLPLCVLIHFDKATSIIYYRKVVQQTSIVVSLAVESTTIITKSNSVNVLHGGDFGFAIFLWCSVKYLIILFMQIFYTRLTFVEYKH